MDGLVDGTQILAFVNALKTNTPSAAAGGYKGFSFWTCQDHSVAPDKWPAIASATLANPPAHAARFQSVNAQPDHSLQFTASGDIGATYVIETSSNMLDWQFFASLVATNGTLSFSANPATNGAVVFSRQIRPVTDVKGRSRERRFLPSRSCI